VGTEEAVLWGLVEHGHATKARRMFLAMGAFCALGVVFTLVVGTPQFVALPALSLIAMVAGFASAERDPGPRDGAEGQLWLSEHEVHVAREGVEEVTIDRGRIVDGWIEPSFDGEWHKLVLMAEDGQELHLSQPDSSDELREILSALGLDERAVRMRLVADPRNVRAWMGAFMGVMLLGAVGPLSFVIAQLFVSEPASANTLVAMVIFASVFLAAVLAMPHFLVDSRVLIGHDGVLLKPFLRRQRFVPFDRLTHARNDSVTLRLVRHDESVVSTRASIGAAAAVAQVINERLERFRAERGEQAMAALERGSRSSDDYRQMLASLLEAGRATFRQGAVDAESLIDVVENPRATPTQRVGAAFALAAHDQVPGERLRIAVNACAEPRLRVALERATGGELDEDALASAEAESAEARG
jgi:hypothetical protein